MLMMHDYVLIHPKNKIKWQALYTSKSDFLNYCIERYADEFLQGKNEPTVEPVEE